MIKLIEFFKKDTLVLLPANFLSRDKLMTLLMKEEAKKASKIATTDLISNSVLASN